MQKLWTEQASLQHTTDQILTISRTVYKALQPLDQVMAQALEKVGKVRIVDGDD